MATIKDIAKLAGVSKSTVSRVVSKSGFVKPDTRKKIEKVIKEINYKPNVFAKGMRTNKSYSIGIIFPEISNTFFAQWYQIVDKMARAQGYLNYICITDPEGETESKRLDDLVARNIDGIIMFSYCKHPEVVEKMQEISQHTPLICCDAMMEDTGLFCIYADGYQGTYEAVKSLIADGHKRIAYVGGRKPYQVVERRGEGYYKAMEEAGLLVDPDLLYSSEFRKDCGYKAAKQFMELDNPPDAIVTSTDMMAIGVVDYLQEQGLAIPQQVAVFACNDNDMMESVSPSLSTIVYPVQEMAETTISTMVEMIEKPQPHYDNRVFDCNLVMRESTKISKKIISPFGE